MHNQTAKDFIRHLLVLNPQQRFTAQEALRHPFITSHCGEVIPPVSEMAATHISTSAPTLPSVSATHPVKKQPERGSTSTVGNTTTAPTVVKTRPLGVKNAVDDSGCVTSNETLSNSVPTVAAGLPSEKNGAKKAGGIFGSKGSGGGIAGWFRGTAGKSSNKLTDKV